MNILPLALFVATCFAADSSSRADSIDKEDSQAMNTGQPSENLSYFLHSYETCLSKIGGHLLSFGIALGAQGDITSCNNDELEMKVSKEKLLEIINAEYPKPTEYSNPFYESFHIDFLIEELNTIDSDMTLAEFRNIMSKSSKADTVMFSMDLAILYWLKDAIKMNSDVKIDPSWIQHLCTLIYYRGARKHCMDDILFILTHVQRLIDSKSLTRDQIAPLLTLFSVIRDDGPIAQKLLEFSINYGLKGKVTF